MKHAAPRSVKATLPLVRCAVYTRKSTEEGLEQEFNSLDAQRESGEAFVASQQQEGWRCLPERYDDGGFTGGNMDRPGLKRLMADTEAGKIDCVVVYKVDRLSRSLLDFARMMQVFDERGVSFVSVTQAFNTATSMGRLVLNVLLSFAQFEREIISERTRDKVAATRRKGKWAGGRPVLGYDLDRERSRLTVNEDEAQQVRAIFALYLKHEGLLAVARELEARGWRNKRHVTRAGKDCGGEEFSKTALHRLLTNPTYIGKVKYKDEVHEGEHPAIIDEATWLKAQALLRRNGHAGDERSCSGAILKGLLFCGPCGKAMTPSHTTKGSRRYAYYACTNGQRHGKGACPTGSLPAGEVESVVLDQVRSVGRDPALAAEALAQARRQDGERLAGLQEERRAAERELARCESEERLMLGQLKKGGDTKVIVPRLAVLQDRSEQAQRRIARAAEGLNDAREAALDEGAAREALARFTPVWEALQPREQARLVALLVKRVEVNRGKLTIAFHDAGVRALADQIAEHHREQSA
jgi:site-specific DNA recombinase